MNGHSVFISYSHQDLDPAWLEAFAAALRDRDVRVWLDEWEIKPGDRIAEALETGLRASDAVVAVIPSASIERPSLYFELGAALGANKRLILVLDPSSATSIPYDLRQRRWIAFKTPEETAREVAEAIEAAA
jgi:TIR domain